MKQGLFIFLLASAVVVANECNFRISSGNPADLQSALNLAMNNRQDDVVCVEGYYALDSTLFYQHEGSECGRSFVLRGVGKGAVLDGQGKVQVFSILGRCEGKIILEGLVIQRGTGAVRIKTNKEEVILTRNVFRDNETKFMGAGVDIKSDRGPITLSGNEFQNNRSSFGGGASVVSRKGDVVLVNNVFSGNRAEKYSGGGVYVEVLNGSVFFINNTINENISSLSGGGAYIALKEGRVHIYNNIFYKNEPHGGGPDGGELFVESSSVVLAYNLFSPGERIDFSRPPQGKKVFINAVRYNDKVRCPGAKQYGNFQAKPYLTQNFYPSYRSPFINAGCNDAPKMPTVDLLGNPRVEYGIVDMGAYEYGPFTSNSKPFKPLE